MTGEIKEKREATVMRETDTKRKWGMGAGGEPGGKLWDILSE